MIIHCLTKNKGHCLLFWWRWNNLVIQNVYSADLLFGNILLLNNAKTCWHLFFFFPWLGSEYSYGQSCCMCFLSLDRLSCFCCLSWKCHMMLLESVWSTDLNSFWCSLPVCSSRITLPSAVQPLQECIPGVRKAFSDPTVITLPASWTLKAFLNS